MTTTETATQIVQTTRGTVTAIHTADGKVLGRVIKKSTSQFVGSRIKGEAGVDIRKMSSFRSHAAAVAFITKIA